MNLANWLMRTAQVSGDQPALFHGTDQIANYAELANMVQSCAAWLQDNGVAPGDHIGIFMKNTPEYLAVFYGNSLKEGWLLETFSKLFVSFFCINSSLC